MSFRIGKIYPPPSTLRASTFIWTSGCPCGTILLTKRVSLRRIQLYTVLLEQLKDKFISLTSITDQVMQQKCIFTHLLSPLFDKLSYNSLRLSNILCQQVLTSNYLFGQWDTNSTLILYWQFIIISIYLFLIFFLDSYLLVKNLVISPFLISG